MIASRWFKFGGVEFFKVNAAQSLGPAKAWENKTAIYLGASAAAEFIADLFLCPLEAVRIRAVSDSTFPKGLLPGAARMLSTDGLLGFYAGLGPILFKQVRAVRAWSMNSPNSRAASRTTRVPLRILLHCKRSFISSPVDCPLLTPPGAVHDGRIYVNGVFVLYMVDLAAGAVHDGQVRRAGQRCGVHLRQDRPAQHADIWHQPLRFAGLGCHRRCAEGAPLLTAV